MERKLDNLMDSMMQNEGVIGILISDNQGLSYGTRGKANTNSSGVITAISQQASKLHPNLDAPVVILESDSASATISKYGQYTSAIYKKKSERK